MRDVEVLDGEWYLYHLDDVLALQYQSSDWTKHTTNQSCICWGNLLVPGTMREQTSHEANLDLDSCFDHHLGLISRP